MKKIRLGLIGLGAMGMGHFNIYRQLMEEGFPLELVAVCDIDRKKFESTENKDTNLEEFKDSKVDFSQFKCYTKYEDMIAKEELDMVSVVIPTYLHYEATVYALKHGLHVLCEKPMALSEKLCQTMIDVAKKNGKRLMIGQCLRFWGEYVAAKEIIDSGKYGKVIGARFYRGGQMPASPWFFERHKGGGALFDQHIHDVDMVNWMFGMPKAVSAIGCTAIPGSGYDIVSANYIYENGIAVTTQDDWMNFTPEFKMEFRINLEKATIMYNANGFTVKADEKAGIDYDLYMAQPTEDVTPEIVSGQGYYNEVKYFVNCILNNTENTVNPPEDSMNTIRIALAETKSCDLKGQVIEL